MLGRVILFIGNKLFISLYYTNVGIKKEVENKTKTYLERLNLTTNLQNLTCLQVRNTYIYTYREKWEAETRDRAKRVIGQCFS